MELWAKGILEAETKELYATHAMMLLCDSLWFFFSIIWRALVVGFLFWVVSHISPGLTNSFQAILLSKDTASHAHGLPLILLIISTVFVFGGNLYEWLARSLLCIVMMASGMQILRLLGRGILRDWRMLRLMLTGNSIFGVYIAITFGCLPRAIETQINHIMETGDRT